MTTATNVHALPRRADSRQAVTDHVAHLAASVPVPDREGLARLVTLFRHPHDTAHPFTTDVPAAA